MNSQTQALKPAIRKLIHSSQVKPEAVRVIVEGLEDENVTPEDWEALFNKEGAEIAIKQKIYSPQMVRLITLRAIVIPETLQEFLAWLNIQKSKKPDEHQTVSLEFQKDIHVKVLIAIKRLYISMERRWVVRDSPVHRLRELGGVGVLQAVGKRREEVVGGVLGTYNPLAHRESLRDRRAQDIRDGWVDEHLIPEIECVCV